MHRLESYGGGGREEDDKEYGPPEDRFIYVRNQYYAHPLAAELNHACIPVWQSIVGSCSCGGDS